MPPSSSTYPATAPPASGPSPGPTRQWSAERCYPLAGRLIPWLSAAAAALCAIGLYIAFFVAPTNAGLGEHYRIIFIHSPAAWMSQLLYLLMVLAAGFGLLTRHKLSSMLASALGPTGAMFAFLALWTGSLMGRPAWGVWWVWDARLTVELLLLFLFLGFNALQAAIDDSSRADRAGGVLAIVGLLGLPVLYYSVNWWRAGQPGVSIDLSVMPDVASSVLPGIAAMMLGLAAYSAAVALVRLRIIILERERTSEWVIRRFDERS